MEEINQVLIERYFAQELSAAERNDIEQRVQKDAQFRQEMAAYKLAMESIKLAQRADLKERFRQRDKVLDRRNKDFNIGRRGNLWMLAAAAIIVVFIGWRFYSAPQQSSDQANVNQKDTNNLVENPGIVPDTTKSTYLPKEEKKENKIPAKTKDEGQDLYAANFEAYKDDSMDPTSRGDEENLSPLEKFQMLYWEGKYAQTLEAFKTLDPSHQVNDNFRFIYANALMATSKTNEAAAIFSEIISFGKSPYKIESTYYLALCHLKNGNYDEARKNLEAYLRDPDAEQKEKAKKILADMG